MPVCLATSCSCRRFFCPLDREVVAPAEQVRFFGHREARQLLKGRLNGAALLHADASGLAELGIPRYLRTLILAEARLLRSAALLHNDAEADAGAAVAGGHVGVPGCGGPDDPWCIAPNVGAVDGWAGGSVWAVEQAELEVERRALFAIAQVLRAMSHILNHLPQAACLVVLLCLAQRPILHLKSRYLRNCCWPYVLHFLSLTAPGHICCASRSTYAV